MVPLLPEHYALIAHALLVPELAAAELGEALVFPFSVGNVKL
jgi:hypothetical protein